MYNVRNLRKLPILGDSHQSISRDFYMYIYISIPFLNSPILVYTYVGYVLTKAHMID